MTERFVDRNPGGDGGLAPGAGRARPRSPLARRPRHSGARAMPSGARAPGGRWRIAARSSTILETFGRYLDRRPGAVDEMKRLSAQIASDLKVRPAPRSIAVKSGKNSSKLEQQKQERQKQEQQERERRKAKTRDRGGLSM